GAEWAAGCRPVAGRSSGPQSLAGDPRRGRRLLRATAARVAAAPLSLARRPGERGPRAHADRGRGDQAGGLSVRLRPTVIRIYRFAFSTNVEGVAVALAHNGLGAGSVWMEPDDRWQIGR